MARGTATAASSSTATVNGLQYAEPAQNPTSAYYVHPTENTNVALVKTVLTGTRNYHPWSRMMKKALITKKKFKIVDGTIAMPTDPFDPTVEAYDRCNILIHRWIVNSVSKPIAQELDQPLFINPGTVIVLEPAEVIKEPPKPVEEPSFNVIAENMNDENLHIKELAIVPYGFSHEEGTQADVGQTQGEFDMNVTPINENEEENHEDQQQLSPN